MTIRQRTIRQIGNWLTISSVILGFLFNINTSNAEVSDLKSVKTVKNIKTVKNVKTVKSVKTYYCDKYIPEVEKLHSIQPLCSSSASIMAQQVLEKFLKQEKKRKEQITLLSSRTYYTKSDGTNSQKVNFGSSEKKEYSVWLVTSYDNKTSECTAKKVINQCQIQEQIAEKVIEKPSQQNVPIVEVDCLQKQTNNNSMSATNGLCNDVGAQWSEYVLNDYLKENGIPKTPEGKSCTLWTYTYDTQNITNQLTTTRRSYELDQGWGCDPKIAVYYDSTLTFEKRPDNTCQMTSCYIRKYKEENNYDF